MPGSHLYGCADTDKYGSADSFASANSRADFNPGNRYHNDD